jgi:hypothetical protein
MTPERSPKPTEEPAQAPEIGSVIKIEERLEQFLATSIDAHPLDEALARSVSAEHLSAFLRIVEQREQNRHLEVTKAKSSTSSMTIILVALSLAFIVVSLWLCLSYNHPEILTPILTAVGGLLGGVGISKLFENRKKPDQ